ncbi:OTU domain-containing protein 5 [Folsomia candida]|uniref:ubiquitinyl hydrolase 1 n=1 Tax=Folsomia candida TaxID=158441 RepID=A0A226CUH3_FOLCA|nr:OTU domain-containing protein 5 [Folsomia candida]
MTILTKKKGGNSSKSGGNGEADSGDHGGGAHVLPILWYCHKFRWDRNLVFNLTFYFRKSSEIIPESLSLNPDRLYGTSSPSSQLWSSQNLSHNLNLSLGNTREEKRASQQAQYDVESPNPHPIALLGTKRRHVNNAINAHHHSHATHPLPLRCSSRSKHSRLDRGGDHGRSSGTSSPNPGSPNVSVSSPAPQVLPDAICQGLPNMSSSPEVAYNSEDEYEAQPHSQLSEEEWAERERRFEKKMRKKGYIIKKMGEDGACLFRAVSDQVYGDQEMHTVVRKHCMDYIAANGDYYSQYVTEDFNHYVNRKRLEYVHGNHIEIQAMSEMYNRTIEVFCYSTDPINIFHGTNQSDNEPIRLSYHRGVHYNSLVDPYKATVGVGLGLPGHIPGLADKNVVKEATRQSEDMLIEQAMLEDKLRATDWEATNEALEEQVARESYLQWLKDNERRNRAVRSPTTATSSSSATSTSASSSEVRSPRVKMSSKTSQSGGANISPLGSPFRGEPPPSFKHSPSRLSPPPSLPGPSRPPPSKSPPKSPTGTATDSHNFQLLETSSFINQLPPELFGMNEWEDAGLMAQVLAVSQQEYLDNLKQRNRDPSPPPPPSSDDGSSSSSHQPQK